MGNETETASLKKRITLHKSDKTNIKKTDTNNRSIGKFEINSPNYKYKEAFFIYNSTGTS
jgi:hypothetical protein